MSHDIDVQRFKKNSQPLKCRRLKKSISQTLSIIIEKKEKEKKDEEEKEKDEEEKEKNAKEEKEREKKANEEKTKEEKEKEKEKKKNAKEMEKQKEKVKQKEKAKAKKIGKKVKVASRDVKRQYPFEGFNIDGEGPTELMSSFSQWINEGFYKHHAKKSK
ncbi:hypothetical protein EJD97_000339 [Solanum chilense]|uniref:Uncharacterized protein n=1 Tax=Solanum chilense TaxID=4083 RepID=A0A6N2C2J0_SOLCI|nr:hypothetical protein EJD97_000339 [Solanum chilense]